ncbi:MAG: hypothetical protein IT177_00885 [Acidobacteria bacterium]|nr:hypothetical protein [Acidobacteriota bacterium]
MSKTTRPVPPAEPPPFVSSADLPTVLVVTPIRSRIEKMQTALVSALGNIQTALWLAAADDDALHQAYNTQFSVDGQEHLTVGLARLAEALEELYWLQRLPDHVQELVAPDDDEEDALTAAGQPSRPPSDPDTSVAGGVQ